MTPATHDTVPRWGARLEEQNGTVRKALFVSELPDGPTAMAVDLGYVPTFEHMVQVVMFALVPALQPYAAQIKPGDTFLHCPVDVRDAQKNDDAPYDLYAAIRRGERAAVLHVLRTALGTNEEN